MNTTTNDIAALAASISAQLTSRGNLELGDDNQGTHGTPGQSYHEARVRYYLLANGDFQAVVDDRYGSNQGYLEQHGGDVNRIDGATLDEAISGAENLLGDSSDLAKAWHIASAQARATMRRIDSAQRQAEQVNPLAAYTIEQLQEELARRQS